MEMNEEQPNVICFALHLLGMDKMDFDANDVTTSNLQKVKNGMTTTYFMRCVIDADIKQYMYIEFLQHCVWNINTTKNGHPNKLDFP
jgi:hypothetical protein